KGFVYLRAEYPLAHERLGGAITQAREAGLLGPDVMGSGLAFDIELRRGAGAYICGEETALLDSLEGKRGNPRLKPPFPAVKGLYQGPTLINNVETLMNAPIIMRMGDDGYAKLGTERSTGTKVVSVSGCVQRPGNYEIPLGTPFPTLLELAGGVRKGRKLKAVIPGGSSAP
ncbi:MAG: SLBB domain-containing protein, partial [Gammaproteobacteria bacterium]